jgi:hypothetical protein
MKTTHRKRIKDYPDYWIYEDGSVWSGRGLGQFLNPSLTAKGYLHVSLHNAAGKKTFKIHRLVAAHFPQTLEVR